MLLDKVYVVRYSCADSKSFSGGGSEGYLSLGGGGSEAYFKKIL